MVALEILINGNRLCTAGADNLNMLTVSLVVNGLLGEHAVPPKEREVKEAERGNIRDSFFRVGGMAGRDNHLQWNPGTKLSIGDVVEIRLVQIAPEATDPPEPADAADPKKLMEFARGSFERAKARYLRLRDQNEPPAQEP